MRDQSCVKISGICLHEVSLSVPSEDFELQSFGFKETQNPKENPRKTHHVIAGLRSGQPRATGFQHGLRKLFSILLYLAKLAHRKFLVFLNASRAQSSKFQTERMLLNNKEGNNSLTQNECFYFDMSAC